MPESGLRFSVTETGYRGRQYDYMRMQHIVKGKHEKSP